ncbi:methyl-accepting chemotaxis protein [Pantoea eucrina]|uniref:Methyl-accepting chemotaxis protein n=1 Tax=Pantoea eucrina TaxID=472693 RepID=A0ABU5LEP5_9GAMM|nr:methyl-accepting chemotaxis protein [Pantoea eucrina]MDZ7278414.1 methyl-accepting chemotaxis protein [Pantoea eucrina]
MKKMLNKINLPAKFIMLGVFALVLFVFPTYLFINTGNQIINAKVVELDGIPVEKKMLLLLNKIQRHRAESAIAISLGKPDNAPRLELVDQVARLETEINAELRQTDPNAQPLARMDKVSQGWNALQADLNDKKLSLSDSLNRHAALIQSLLMANQDVLDFYGLSLDSDLDSYQLIISIFSRMPLLTETLGQIRAHGTSLIAQGDAAMTAGMSNMAFRIENGKVALDQFSGNMDKVFSISPELKTQFAMQNDDANQQALKALGLAENVFVNKTATVAPTEYVRVFTEAINSYSTLGTQYADKLTQLLNAQIQDRRHSQYWLLAALLAIAVIAVIFAVMISRSVTGPIENAVRTAGSVAAGDLTNEISVQGTNETARLLGSLKQMQDRLSQLVANIKDNALTIASSSEQIAKGNGHLSARTEEQAASLAETAASMEQMASIIGQNAENTQHATTMAEAATDASMLSGKAMDSVMETMSKIRGSSAKIEEITSVIDSIAFQTNILALNAAVEAARAGESGKGFAVVASEVRSLAQRSATAAREIKELIAQSVNHAEEGLALAKNAGDRVKQSVEAIEQTTQLIRDISSSSKEQSSGIAQINIAVNQMDQVTQQNAALVEESATSAGDLAGRAAHLRDMVVVFKTH